MATLVAPAPTSTTSSTPAPAGNHIGRCVSMIQIGTVEETFKGETKQQHKVRLTWELPFELREPKEGEEARPFLISKSYTLSMYSKATLRQHLESWRGKPFTDKEADAFDILKLLGAVCMVNVMHKTSEKGNTYAAVTSLATLGKGMTCPDQVTPAQVLTYDDFKWDVFDGLPEFIRKDIETTPEFKALKRPSDKAAPSQPTAEQKAAAAPAPSDEELPF